MFNSLTGVLKSAGDERLVVEAGALEWEVWTTGQTLAALPARGKSVRLLTHLYHREDALRLYGFATEEERSLFLELIRVEGVGPRLALKILSGIAADRFVQAVDAENLAILQAVPGLGQKTAAKIILRLRGRLVSTGRPTGHEELLVALTGMGFDRRDAAAALEMASRDLGQTDLSGEMLERELLTRSMKALADKKVR